MGAAETVEDAVEDAKESTEISVPKKNVIVRFAVTAGFERDKKIVDFPFVSQLGSLWNVNDSTAQLFVSKIEEKFRKKGKIHGNFDPESDYKTAEHLHQYLDSTDFDLFIRALCKSLERAGNVTERKGLVGGNIVFVHYTSFEENDLGHILVVMLGNQSGFEFDSNLQPKSLTSINISDLKQAALFDLNLFSAVYPNVGEDAYLRFIQAGSKSAFIQDALGCKKSQSNKDSADGVITALRGFVKEHKIPLTLRDAIETSIQDLFFKKAKSKTDRVIRLAEIQNVVDDLLPLDSPHRNQFATYVNAHECEINDFFEVASITAKSLLEVVLSDSSRNYECRIKSTSVGTETSGKPIVVDDDYQYLRVKLSEESSLVLRQLLGHSDE